MQHLSETSKLLDSRVVDALRACRQVLAQKQWDSCMEVVLYGSQARGNAAPDSDLDLLIIVDESMCSAPKGTIHDTLYEISLQYDVVLSIIITTRQQWESSLTKSLPLYQDIMQEGIRVA